MDALSERLVGREWPASWVTVEGIEPFGYAVAIFRRRIELESVPSSLPVHVSADNGYKLYVNGRMVGFGPAHGDLRNWRFETYDLAPFLVTGENVIAVVVWNHGEHRPMARASHRHGFIFQPDSEQYDDWASGRSWKGRIIRAYWPNVYRDNDQRLGWNYYVAGATESFLSSEYPWGWQLPSFDDQGWPEAYVIDAGAPIGVESHQKWQLTPRTTPLQRVADPVELKVGRIYGHDVIVTQGPRGNVFAVEPYRDVRLLLDAGELVTGFPTVDFLKGSGAEVRLAYAEALQEADGKRPLRSVTEDLELVGVEDVVRLDGLGARRYEPLLPRSFRWLELRILTADEPVEFGSVGIRKIGFPTEFNATFQCDDAALNGVFKVASRTLQLSAQDNFLSDLYWERLQYVGDAHIQAQSWHALTGDQTLYRNAVLDFGNILAPWGLTQSRFPADLEQFSPAYSLIFIRLVRDYVARTGDVTVLPQVQMALDSVLLWFLDRLNERGVLSVQPHLDFVDHLYWSRREQFDELKGDRSSCVHTCFLINALNAYVQLGPYLKHGHLVDLAKTHLAEVRKKAFELFWDSEQGVFRDHPDRPDWTSGQAQVAAATADIAPKEIRQELLRRAVIEHAFFPRVDLYMRFFAMQRMSGDMLYDAFGPWKQMLNLGMTACGECENDPRSECHPWSAYPVQLMLEKIAGLRRRPFTNIVEVNPDLGKLNKVHVVMPMTVGRDTLLELKAERKGGKISVIAEAPAGWALALPDGTIVEGKTEFSI